MSTAVEYTTFALSTAVVLLFLFRRQIKCAFRGDPPRKSSPEELEKIVIEHKQRKWERRKD